MNEPIDLDAKRKERQRVAQWTCQECGFAIWHLFDTGQVICANCETEAANLSVKEIIESN